MKIREWVVISLILGFLLSMGVITKFSNLDAKNFILGNPLPKTITITLEGAVSKPGKYQCQPGTQVKDLLKNVGLKPAANRKRIPLKKILLADQTIEILEKKGKTSERKKISLEEN